MLSPTNCKLRSLGIIVDDDDKRNLERRKEQLKLKFYQVLSTMSNNERNIALKYLSTRRVDTLLNAQLTTDQWQKIQQYIMYNDLVIAIDNEIYKLIIN